MGDFHSDDDLRDGIRARCAGAREPALHAARRRTGGRFYSGVWIAIAGLAACVVGYLREFKGLHCLLGVVPAALYAANPWSVMVFVKFTGG